MQIFTAGGPGRRRLIRWLFPLTALLTFIFSWASVYPTALIEGWYAKSVYPKISSIAASFADAISISWLDVAVPVGIFAALTLSLKRRWVVLINVAAVLYLLFFWSWGLNYHREPLRSRLPLDSERMKPELMSEFAARAAGELNRLYVEKQNRPIAGESVRSEAGRRVRKVVAVIDHSDWNSPERIKVSRLTNLWLKAAGIDGLFNPLGHEPVVSSSLLDIEQPFVMTHELAHVRGYPEEGDANLIAALSTLMSGDPHFQYSGWMHLWLYLRTRELDKLLDDGPRADVERIFARARREQVAWISAFQRGLLDVFLKANSVDEGVRSYSRVVLLAAGAEPYWDRFR